MKNLIFPIATTLTLIFGLNLSLSAQTTATWQGGKPGRTTCWNCAGNWKEGRVPDEFSQVSIPAGSTYFPVIKGVVQPIDALLIEGGARLSLQPNAVLTVLGETGRFNGLMVLGTVLNDGLLAIGNTEEWDAAQQQINGIGKVVRIKPGIDSLARQ